MKSGCLCSFNAELEALCKISWEEVERALLSPRQRGGCRWVLWGTQGPPWQARLQVSNSWKRVHPGAWSVSAPWQVGTEICAQEAPQTQGSSRRRHWGTAREGHRALSLAWPADGGLGMSWDPCPAQTPLPRPEELLVLSSWILTLWGRGFNCLHNCCQQEIWLLQPQAPLQNWGELCGHLERPHNTYNRRWGRFLTAVQCSIGGQEASGINWNESFRLWINRNCLRMREAVGRVTLSAISIPRGFQAPAGPSHEQPALALLWARSGLETSQGTSQAELYHHPMITSKCF